MVTWAPAQTARPGEGQGDILWDLRPEQFKGRPLNRSVSEARRELLVRAHEESGLTAAKLSKICQITHVSVRQVLLRAQPSER